MDRNYAAQSLDVQQDEPDEGMAQAVPEDNEGAIPELAEEGEDEDL